MTALYGRGEREGGTKGALFETEKMSWVFCLNFLRVFHLEILAYQECGPLRWMLVYVIWIKEQ